MTYKQRKQYNIISPFEECFLNTVGIFSKLVNFLNLEQVSAKIVYKIMFKN